MVMYQIYIFKNTVLIKEQGFEYNHLLAWYGRKLNGFHKVAELLMTNSRIFENFLCGKMF